MAIYQVSSYNNNSVLNKIPLKNGYIYHMTHIEHLPSILAHGLLPHNNPYKKHDISNKSANDKRERIEPIHNRSVHEYVPFYFNPRNAMLYVVQKEQGDNIVLLEIKKEILLLNGVIFTNGNAAAQSLGFADDIDDLLNPSFINWDEVFATSWNDTNENVKNEKKFKMMAEVLVPDMVPSAMIAGIVCQNPSVCEKVAKLLNNSINISWNSSLFFNDSSDTTANQKREFKYHPQTNEELLALVDNEDIYLGDIDTSAITDMSYLFFKGYENGEVIINERENFDGIEFWDVSNVTDMSCMFWGCENFNQPLNSWNVSNVTNMYCMFGNCENFNQPLNSWNVSNVVYMSEMFWVCTNFNQPLNYWNVSNVTNMEHMFSGCENFNQPLNSWNVSNVTNMGYMFLGCKNFNQPLNSWNVELYVFGL
nr:DarT ssDNA thymidine ADP-ribosyltransferase family protein [uncultured Campylobacter sp.]